MKSKGICAECKNEGRLRLLDGGLLFCDCWAGRDARRVAQEEADRKSREARLAAARGQAVAPRVSSICGQEGCTLWYVHSHLEPSPEAKKAQTVERLFRELRDLDPVSRETVIHRVVVHQLKVLSRALSPFTLPALEGPFHEEQK